MNLLEYKISNGFRSSVPKGFYDPIKKHSGIDIVCPVGTKIILPFDVVAFAQLVQPEMGNVQYVKHGEDTIVFAHLVSFLPHKKGDVIKAGSVIGLTGNTGSRTTNPHCHIEIIRDIPEEGFEMMSRNLGIVQGFNIDPTDYFKKDWSDEAFSWLVEHKFIEKKRKPTEPVLWGEFAVLLYRIAKKIMEWTKS